MKNLYIISVSSDHHFMYTFEAKHYNGYINACDDEYGVSVLKVPESTTYEDLGIHQNDLLDETWYD